MKGVFQITFLFTTLTLAYSWPFVPREDSPKPSFPLLESVNKENAEFQKNVVDGIEWLSKILQHHKQRPGDVIPEALYLETHHQAAGIQDLNDVFKQLIDIFSQVLNATGDYVSDKVLKKKYGIDDKALQVYRNLVDILHIGASLNQVDTHIIDDNVREKIRQVAEKVEYVLNYFLDRTIKDHNIDTSGCSNSISSKVEAPDGWQPFFTVMKIYFSKINCLNLNKLYHDGLITEDERKIYQNFFDIVTKLYETETLNDEDDKNTLKTSMRYYIQQVHKLNFSESIVNAVEDVTNILVKMLCGEQISFIDKYRGVKSFFTIYMAHLRGKNVISTLTTSRKTFMFANSLIPIALKIGITKYTKGLKTNSEKTLSSRTRELLTNGSSILNSLLNNILQSIKNGFKNNPKHLTTLHVHIQNGKSEGNGSSRDADTDAKLMHWLHQLSRNSKHDGSHQRAIES